MGLASLQAVTCCPAITPDSGRRETEMASQVNGHAAIGGRARHRDTAIDRCKGMRSGALEVVSTGGDADSQQDETARLIGWINFDHQRIGRWTMQQLCEELDLVVDLQQLAIADQPAYRAFIHGRETALSLWLYEMAVSAAAQGWREFAPTLMNALPDIDCGALIPLLDEILRGHDSEKTGARKPGFGGAVFGGNGPLRLVGGA